MEKEHFDLTLKYLKTTVNLKKQCELYKKRGNESYPLYGFAWVFVVIYIICGLEKFKLLYISVHLFIILLISNLDI